MKTYKDIVREMIDEKITFYKEEKKDSIQKDESYYEFYNQYKSYFFEFVLAERLGTSKFSSPNSVTVEEKIGSFINSLSLYSLRLIIFIDSTVIDLFTQKLVEADDFILYYNANLDLLKEVDEYIASGNFNKREQILIDYLKKTKATDADAFLVKSIYGGSAICYNHITCSGMISSVEEWLFVSDVEDVEQVTDGDRVIYEKSIF